LAHAKKFRAKGTVRVTARDDHGWIEVRLEFDSLAIPPDAQGGMLDLWQPAAAREGRGTSCVGLGLGFAAALTRLHGGDLEFSMDEAHACKIVLRIPSKRAA
ncbi:ATP-binding protein, partial [bacterium]